MAFGGIEAMLEKLQDEAVNHFASGWAWLVLDRGTLRDHLAARCRHADRPRRHGAAVHARCVGACLLHRLSQRAAATSPRAVLSNIVNWDFVATNLDGKGADRADQDGADARAAGDYCLSR